MRTQLKMASVLGLAVLLSACATMQRHENSAEYHEWAFTQARTIDLPMSVADSLENAQVGDVIQVGPTSLGSESTYSISQRYFAASGRPCFKGQLVSERSQQRMVVCRYSRNEWVATRAVAEEFGDVHSYDNVSSYDSQPNSQGGRTQ